LAILTVPLADLWTSAWWTVAIKTHWLFIEDNLKLMCTAQHDMKHVTCTLWYSKSI
jgi:hypothetical protein